MHLSEGEVSQEQKQIKLSSLGSSSIVFIIFLR